MTKEEFKSKLKNLEDQYNENRKIIAIEYARQNNPYKIGEIISDNFCTIRIEKISVSWIGDDPKNVYTGIKINKDGTDNKNGKKETIYQSNIKP